MPRYQRLSQRRKIQRKRVRHRAAEAAQEASPRSRKTKRLSKRRQVTTSRVSSGMCYDTQFGRIYTSAPGIIDDLTKVPGIDANAQRHLQALGLYKLEQLRRLTPDQIQSVQAHGIPLEVDQLWKRWQADVRGDTSQTATKDATSTSLPAQPLHHLTGISPSLEAALASLGIHRFFQIALWDSATCRQFAQRLGLPSDQIQQQCWVKQAQAKG